MNCWLLLLLALGSSRILLFIIIAGVTQVRGHLIIGADDVVSGRPPKLQILRLLSEF